MAFLLDIVLHFKCPISWFLCPRKDPISNLPSFCSPINFLPLPCPVLVFLYTAASNLSRTKGLSSLWCLTRPSSAAYESGAMGNSMCTLWLMVLSLGALGLLGDSYCCSFCGAANPFSSLDPFSSSSIGDPVPWLSESVALCICHALAEYPR